MPVPLIRLDRQIPIGRETQAERLAQLINDTAIGAKRAALLLGVPGIGKTTLLRWAVGVAEHRGCLCALVRVPAAAGLPPRFPLGELLEGIARACERRSLSPPERLRRVVDTLTGATTVEEYAVALPQIADAIEEAGRLAPIGIFVDDYDRAPVEGTGLLMAALRVAEAPLCLVASARLRGLDSEMPSPFPEPTADLWIDHLEVRGLSPAAIGQIAEGLLGAPVLPSLVDALNARTLGNPLFIVETLQSWREDQALTETGGFFGVAEEAVLLEARSLREMIGGRLARLAGDAVSLARAIAVIGRAVACDELRLVVDMDDARLAELLTELTRDGIVACDEQPAPVYRIAHPLYEHSLIEDMGATSRALLHDRISEVARRRSAGGHHVTAAELAHHAVRALSRPIDLHDLLAGAAAEAESAGSFDEAAVWYGHLAEIANDPVDLVTAFAGRGNAAILADPQLAAQLFSYALEIERRPAERARLLLGRARAERVAGTMDEALADLQEALVVAASEDRFEIRHAILAVFGMRGRLDELDSGAAALAAETAGTPFHCKVIGIQGMLAFARGFPVEAAELQFAALAACEDPSYQAHLRSNLSWMCIVLGRWNDAAALVRDGLEVAIRSGNVHDEVSLICNDSRLAAWRGDLATAFDHASRGIRLASRLGNPAAQIDARDAMAAALLENDMATQAAALLAEMKELDNGAEPRESAHGFTVVAEACQLAGDLAGARVALDHARSHLEECRLWAVAIDRVEAQISLACGDPLGSLGRLRPWLDESSPFVFHQAQLLEVAAQAFADIGDRSGALRRAEEALQIYTRLGAGRRSERVREWLAAHASRRPGRPRSTLPGRLTEREVEILRLVVLGRSNRDIAEELVISLGTAKKHIENVMAKAGVSRRTELVPFAMSIGVLAVEDLRFDPTGRVVRPGRFGRQPGN
jgi:DNA-binding CsgD family transcriptional regulator